MFDAFCVLNLNDQITNLVKQLIVFFLAHQSRRLYAVVVVGDVVVVVVNFSHFHRLLQNHWANSYETWHKALMDNGD